MKKSNLITKQDMKMLNRIDRDCMKMHVCPPPKTFINMKVHDQDGVLIDETDMISRSWVRNAYNFVCCSFLGIGMAEGASAYDAGSLALMRTDGAIRESNVMPSNSQELTDWVGAVGIATQGIVIGTGIAAESLNSYDLATRILHGNAAGQMAYSAQPVNTAVYANNVWTATARRIFNNNSGASIVVTEVGTIMQMALYQGYDMALMNRDLLAVAKTIANITPYHPIIQSLFKNIHPYRIYNILARGELLNL